MTDEQVENLIRAELNKRDVNFYDMIGRIWEDQLKDQNFWTRFQKNNKLDGDGVYPYSVNTAVQLQIYFFIIIMEDQAII